MADPTAWEEYCRIYDTVADNEQKTGRIDREGRKLLQVAKQRLRAAMREGRPLRKGKIGGQTKNQKTAPTKN